MSARVWSPRVSGKTTTTTASAAAVVVLAWALDASGVTVPIEVVGSAVVLAVAVCSYFLPVRRPGRYEADTEPVEGEET